MKTKARFSDWYIEQCASIFDHTSILMCLLRDVNSNQNHSHFVSNVSMLVSWPIGTYLSQAWHVQCTWGKMSKFQILTQSPASTSVTDWELLSRLILILTYISVFSSIYSFRCFIYVQSFLYEKSLHIGARFTGSVFRGRYSLPNGRSHWNSFRWSVPGDLTLCTGPSIAPPCLENSKVYPKFVNLV